MTTVQQLAIHAHASMFDKGLFDARAQVVASSPGRVNLIGEHTDYNDGFVFPMGLPFRTAIAASARKDGVVSLVSEGFEPVTFALADEPGNVSSWGRYVAGMIALLAEAGVPVTGFDAAVCSDIPAGAGLSSSAALEVASGALVCALAGTQADPVQLAQLGQRVENEIIGLSSGIMDQLISAVAVGGAATLVDCRDLTLTTVELPSSLSVVVLDTMTRRELETSAYDERRASCEVVAAALGVAALRDATLHAINRLPDSFGDDLRRARHVVTEDQRTLAAVDHLRNGDAAAFGQLAAQSHASLRDDFEVSSPALDLMVEIAAAEPGCVGARMTGGGFGGCAVAFVDEALAPTFCQSVTSAYLDQSGLDPHAWICKPSPGMSYERIAR